jgi:hypothetical protein
MHPVFGSIVVAVVSVLLLLFLAFRLGGTSVFGTAGQTSSEFKALLFVYAAAVINWTTAAFTGVAAGVDTSWWAVALCTVAYIVQRGAIKWVRTAFAVGGDAERCDDRRRSGRSTTGALIGLVLIAGFMSGCGSTAGPREIAHLEQTARNAEAFSLAVQKVDTPSASDWAAAKKWVVGQATQMRALADWSTGKRPTIGE